MMSPRSPPRPWHRRCPIREANPKKIITKQAVNSLQNPVVKKRNRILRQAEGEEGPVPGGS